MAKSTKAPEHAEGTDRRNDVVLCGELSAVVEERTLASGDIILTTRISVGRDPRIAAKRGSTKAGPRADTIDCVVWSPRVQRTVRRWQVGDTVLLEGAIRRRFFSGAKGTASRVEVEITRGRRLAAAPSQNTDDLNDS